MKKYKIFLLKLVAAASIACVSYICFVLLLVYFSSYNFNSFKDFLIQETSANNKIIIDSGSNSDYGINSGMIEKHFNKLTINLADTAAVTIKTKLNRIKKFAKEGNIVILPLEYIYYIKDEGVDVFYDSIFFEANHYFKHLSLYEKVKFIFKIPFSSVINTISRDYKSKYFSKKYLYAFLKDQNKTPNDFIEKFKNGDRGDIVYIGKAEMSPEALSMPCQKYIFTKEHIKTSDIGETFKSNLEFMKKLEKDRGIKFIFTYPAVVGDGCYDDTTQYGKRLHLFMKEIKEYIASNGFEFIGDYKDSYFSQNFIHDTWFHLIPEARDIRTKKLIENLEKSKFAKELHAN